MKKIKNVLFFTLMFLPFLIGIITCLSLRGSNLSTTWNDLYQNVALDCTKFYSDFSQVDLFKNFTNWFNTNLSSSEYVNVALGAIYWFTILFIIFLFLDFLIFVPNFAKKLLDWFEKKGSDSGW